MGRREPPDRGILLVAGGIGAALMVGGAGWYGAMPMNGMMNANGPAAWGSGAGWWMSGIGLLAGGLVLVAAIQVRRAQNAAAWSIVAIVAGATGLFTMGSFIIGALIAVVGGVLGLVDTRGAMARPRGG